MSFISKEDINTFLTMYDMSGKVKRPILEELFYVVFFLQFWPSEHKVMHIYCTKAAISAIFLVYNIDQGVL